MSIEGYEQVNDLVRNIIGFREWLLDVEPIDADDHEVYGHKGGMNFTIQWTNGDRTRFCIRLTHDNMFDVQINNLHNYKSTMLQVEKGVPREQLLSLFMTMYEEINAQTNEFLDRHKFNLTDESKEVLKKLNNPY